VLDLYAINGYPEENDFKQKAIEGLDGLIFVWQAGRSQLADNACSEKELRTHLCELGYSLEKIPMVLQYNKMDCDDAMSLDELRNTTNTLPYLDFTEAVATEGVGVFRSLKLVENAIVENFNKHR
jgi:signal recognition particle receptor subunit beta